MEQLREIHTQYPVTVIGHRTPPGGVDVPGLDLTENIGLEFGAYDHYLRFHWIWHRDDVLFMHDDVKLSDVSFFHKVAARLQDGVDQAFVFRDETRAAANQRWHGRAFFCSSRFLVHTLAFLCDCQESKDHVDTHNPQHVLRGQGVHNGFWYDRENIDHTRGKPPVGVRHYNTAILHFARFCGRVGSGRFGVRMNAGGYACIPEFNGGRRGEIKK